ncbi:hypothetical protein [Stieleria varia]|uniref:Uncharacterized protein n=1 Tax=Stieleria varia TaxID=2528005 RepID=A0A5C6ATE1_9BACT|nr:hypothetical protein [Stieleria varia]TWU02990.1 hypothetical protein Pla52n_40790 [Stieleria varia]
MLKKLILRFIVTCCVLTALLVAGIICTCVLATSVPGPYAQALETKDDAQHRRQLETKLVRLVAGGLTPEQRLQLRHEPTMQERFNVQEWSAMMDGLDSQQNPNSQSISQEEINAWIAAEMPLPRGSGLRDPRILFRNGCVVLAARLDAETFSVVLTAELSPQVTPEKLILEITSLRVGHVPLPVDKLAKLLASHQPRANKGITMDLNASPPRIYMDWESSRNGHIRVTDAVIHDGEIEITVAAKQMQKL